MQRGIENLYSFCESVCHSQITKDNDPQYKHGGGDSGHFRGVNQTLEIDDTGSS